MLKVTWTHQLPKFGVRNTKDKKIVLPLIYIVLKSGKTYPKIAHYHHKSDAFIYWLYFPLEIQF